MALLMLEEVAAARDVLRELENRKYRTKEVDEILRKLERLQ